MYGLSEVIVYFDDGEATSEEISELEVLLENPLHSSERARNTWVPLYAAFFDRDVITDNYNRHFREPISEAEKKRGYYG